MDLKCFLLHLLRIIYGKCDRSRTNSSGVTQCLVTWQPLLHMSPAAALIAKTGSPSATKWHYIFMAHTHTLSQQSIRRQRNLGEYISLTHTLSSCHISSWYAMHYALYAYFTLYPRVLRIHWFSYFIHQLGSAEWITRPYECHWAASKNKNRNEWRKFIK